MKTDFSRYCAVALAWILFGCMLPLHAGRIVSDAAAQPAYVSGDITGEGEVSAEDARLALRAAVGLEVYAPETREFLAADVDESKEIDAADARLILRAAVGLEVLPAVVDPRSGMTPTERAQLKKALPIIDGSTSMIPLDAGIRAALYGVSFDEARAQVLHNKTWGAFYNLLWDNIDLLLTTPLSAEQRGISELRDVELTEVPITKEGFVFVVNAKNPVDTLTQQQLKDIYSGKITNWKELGGNDAPIIAYQRNSESGSQNFMIDFMGDTPLMDAPTELRPGEMGYLMDAIAINDNAVNAIGYSVYTYAADMYRDAENTKFIQVDGVAPSRATMASGEYPLTAYNYAVFNAAAPEDAFVRRLVDYILSEEGQTAIAEAGYVAVKQIDYDYADQKGARYTKKGTGGPAPQTPDYYEYALPRYLSYDIPLQGKLPDGTPCFAVSGIRDEALQADINAFLQENYPHLRQEAAALEAEFKGQAEDGGEAGDEDFTDYDGAVIRAVLSVKNAYVSVEMTLSYEGTGNYIPYYDVCACVWDLRTGARVKPEDLFFDGVDINTLLTAFVREQLYDVWGDESDYVGEFTGLPADGWTITAEALYFYRGNPYFATAYSISLYGLPTGSMTSEIVYDSRALFDPELYSVAPQFVETDDHFRYKVENDVAFTELEAAASPFAAQINATVREYMETYFSKEAYLRYSGHEDDVPDARQKISATEIAGRYFIFNTPALLQSYEDAKYTYYPYCRLLIFDLKTGEQLQWTDLLKDGWEEHLIPEDDGPLPEKETLENADAIRFITGREIYFLLKDKETHTAMWITLSFAAVFPEVTDPMEPTQDESQPETEIQPEKETPPAGTESAADTAPHKPTVEEN